MYRERLLRDGIAAADLERVDAAAQAEIDAATQGAKDGPLPGPEEVLADTWSDGTSTWRN